MLIVLNTHYKSQKQNRFTAISKFCLKLKEFVMTIRSFAGFCTLTSLLPIYQLRHLSFVSRFEYMFVYKCNAVMYKEHIMCTRRMMQN